MVIIMFNKKKVKMKDIMEPIYSIETGEMVGILHKDGEIYHVSQIIIVPDESSLTYNARINHRQTMSSYIAQYSVPLHNTEVINVQNRSDYLDKKFKHLLN